MSGAVTIPKALDDRALTSQEVADLLAVSVRSVERWRLRRTGPPYIRVSRRAIRYSSAALRLWRDAQTVRCD